jgi:hypothetical protein
MTYPQSDSQREYRKGRLQAFLDRYVEEVGRPLEATQTTHAFRVRGGTVHMTVTHLADRPSFNPDATPTALEELTGLQDAIAVVIAVPAVSAGREELWNALKATHATLTGIVNRMTKELAG